MSERLVQFRTGELVPTPKERLKFLVSNSDNMFFNFARP